MSKGTRVRLRLSADAKEDLAHLAGHASNLSALVAFASTLPPLSAPAGLSGVARSAEGKTSVPAEDVERVFETILNLCNLKNRLNMTGQEVIDAISASMASHEEKWDQAKQAIANLLDSVGDKHPLALRAKAERLATSHQTVFTDAQLFTDVRPVFNSGATEVAEYLVGYTFLIEYIEGDARRTIEFALDSADLARLKRLVERAETKTATLKSAFRQAGWPSFVVAEQPDASQDRSRNADEPKEP
jgi:hypothetical protein